MTPWVWTMHYVVDMDESLYQRCIYCGAMISDYRNTTQPVGDPPPKGFPLREVFVKVGGNPSITTTRRSQDKNDIIEDCRDKKIIE